MGILSAHTDPCDSLVRWYLTDMRVVCSLHIPPLRRWCWDATNPPFLRGSSPSSPPSVLPCLPVCSKQANYTWWWSGQHRWRYTYIGTTSGGRTRAVISSLDLRIATPFTRERRSGRRTDGVSSEWDASLSLHVHTIRNIPGWQSKQGSTRGHGSRIASFS